MVIYGHEQPRLTAQITGSPPTCSRPSLTDGIISRERMFVNTRLWIFYIELCGFDMYCRCLQIRLCAQRSFLLR